MERMHSTDTIGRNEYDPLVYNVMAYNSKTQLSVLNT